MGIGMMSSSKSENSAGLGKLGAQLRVSCTDLSAATIAGLAHSFAVSRNEIELTGRRPVSKTSLFRYTNPAVRLNRWTAINELALVISTKFLGARSAALSLLVGESTTAIKMTESLFRPVSKS